MAFVLIIIGIVMVLVAVQNNQAQFFQLVAGDFTNQGNFLYWIAAILGIGAVGYVPDLKKISDAFLILVLLVLVLNKGTGLWTGLTTQLSAASAQSPSSNVGSVTGIPDLLTNPLNLNSGSAATNNLIEMPQGLPLEGFAGLPQ